MINNTPQRPEISAEELSIVLIGDLNPKIFQPSWFASQELIRESEADTAKVEIVHADFTSFSTDWFVMQVSRERFSLTVHSFAYKDHLRDLVLGTFSRLSHTPLTQMGMNYSARLHFKNDLDWHCFGHFLIPKSPFTGLLNKPGMRSFGVQGVRPDDRRGFIAVTSEPILISPSPNDAMLRVNDHNERPIEHKTSGAGFFLDIIEQEYNASIDRSKVLIEKLIDRYVDQREFDDGVSK